MNFWEAAAVVCAMIFAGVMMAFAVAIALLPWAAALAVVLVCFRYLGWF